MIRESQLGSTLGAILLSGFLGAFCGMVAGFVYGGFFFPLVGNFFGAMAGAMGGWVSGLLGVLIDRGLGFRIGGLAGGLLCPLMVWKPHGIDDLSYQCWLFVIPAVVGFSIGWRVDKDLADPTPPSAFSFLRVLREGAKTSGARPYRWLRSGVAHSALVTWSDLQRVTCAGATLLIHLWIIISLVYR